MRFILVSADDPNLQRPLEIPDEIVENTKVNPPKKRQKPIKTKIPSKSADNPNLQQTLEIPDEVVENTKVNPPKKRQKPIKTEISPKPTKSVQKSRVYG